MHKRIGNKDLSIEVSFVSNLAKNNRPLNSTSIDVQSIPKTSINIDCSSLLNKTNKYSRLSNKNTKVRLEMGRIKENCPTLNTLNADNPIIFVSNIHKIQNVGVIGESIIDKIANRSEDSPNIILNNKYNYDIRHRVSPLPTEGRILHPKAYIAKDIIYISEYIKSKETDFYLFVLPKVTDIEIECVNFIEQLRIIQENKEDLCRFSSVREEIYNYSSVEYFSKLSKAYRFSIVNQDNNRGILQLHRLRNNLNSFAEKIKKIKDPDCKIKSQQLTDSIRKILCIQRILHKSINNHKKDIMHMLYMRAKIKIGYLYDYITEKYPNCSSAPSSQNILKECQCLREKINALPKTKIEDPMESERCLYAIHDIAISIILRYQNKHFHNRKQFNSLIFNMKLNVHVIKCLTADLISVMACDVFSKSHLSRFNRKKNNLKGIDIKHANDEKLYASLSEAFTHQIVHLLKECEGKDEEHLLLISAIDLFIGLNYLSTKLVNDLQIRYNETIK